MIRWRREEREPLLGARLMRCGAALPWVCGKQVVPVYFSNATEFTSYAKYFGLSYQQMIDYASATMRQRMTTGEPRRAWPDQPA
jgi:hypothetical protein